MHSSKNQFADTASICVCIDSSARIMHDPSQYLHFLSPWLCMPGRCMMLPSPHSGLKGSSPSARHGQQHQRCGAPGSVLSPQFSHSPRPDRPAPAWPSQCFWRHQLACWMEPGQPRKDTEGVGQTPADVKSAQRLCKTAGLAHTSVQERAIAPCSQSTDITKRSARVVDTIEKGAHRYRAVGV